MTEKLIANPTRMIANWRECGRGWRSVEGAGRCPRTMRPGDGARPTAPHRRVLPKSYMRGNIYAMKRTTVFLDDQLRRRMQRLARARGVSFATLVREAMSHYLTAPSGPATLPTVAGRFRSGKGGRPGW